MTDLVQMSKVKAVFSRREKVDKLYYKPTEFLAYRSQPKMTA